MSVVEQTTVPRSPDGPGGDRVVVTERLVAVIDASTSMPWDPSEAPSASMIADLAVSVMNRLSGACHPQRILEAATAAVSAEKDAAGVVATEGGGFVFAAVSLDGSWVVRCGDVSVLIDGVTKWDDRNRAEQVIAGARSLVLESALAQGASVEALRAEDIGREAILPLLRAQAAFRNRPGPFGYALIDGTPVPGHFLEIQLLPPGKHDVVLATDGYPVVAPDLGSSEAALFDRLERDPLMIETLPATKCWQPGMASFDDRAYVRVRVGVDV